VNPGAASQSATGAGGTVANVQTDGGGAAVAAMNEQLAAHLGALPVAGLPTIGGRERLCLVSFFAGIKCAFPSLN
jgi:hypothetical protein